MLACSLTGLQGLAIASIWGGVVFLCIMAIVKP